MLRAAGEGAARFTGHRVGPEEGLHGDGDAVLHTGLQVRDDHVVLVTTVQTELQHLMHANNISRSNVYNVKKFCTDNINIYSTLADTIKLLRAVLHSYLHCRVILSLYDSRL